MKFMEPHLGMGDDEWHLRHDLKLRSFRREYVSGPKLA
jgi:hypothetical protein